MKSVVMFACLLASGSTLFGQTAGSSVEGRVVNATTGAPVKGASVSLRVSRVLSMTASQTAPVSRVNTVESDDLGRFAFRNISPGGYSINAQRQGFLDPGQAQIGRSPEVLMVGENQQLIGVVVRLISHAVISGRVLDAYGEPVAGVQVAALRWAYVNGKRQLTRAGTGSTISTNDLGEYRIAGLAAGNYFVIAGTPRAGMGYSYSDRPPQEAPELSYTDTYYPAAIDAAAATPVRVPASREVRGTDIKLVRVKTISIRGRVIDSGADAMRPAFVTLMPRAGRPMLSSVGRAVQLPGGVFQISGVPPGSYYLVTRRNTEQGQVAAGGSLAIEVGNKNLEGITVQVAPVVDVEGIFNSEPPGRCSGVYVSLQDEIRFSSTPVNVSAGSNFTFKNVVPSTYTLNLPDGGSCYLQSLRFAGRDITDMRVKVDGSGPMEITLAASDAVVEGTVTDSAGKPISNATVTFAPKDGAIPGFRTVPTSRTGAFLASGMRPGTYDVFAWERVEYSAARSPEYLKQFASRAKSITVEATGRQTIQLTSIPATETGESAPPPARLTAKGNLEGQVVNALTGAPLSGATVTLGTQSIVRPQAGMLRTAARAGVNLGRQTAAPGVTAETDEHGRFAIRDIVPDIYFISAERQGFSSAVPPDRPNMIGDQIVVGNGQRITGYTLKLAPQSAIVGTVTDEFGEAVSNAQAVFYRAENVRGVRRLSRQGMAQTDDLGKFRLSGIAPGSYYLAVMKRALGRLAQPRAQAPINAPVTGYGLIWYPNSQDAAGASPIMVGAAAEVPIEVVLRRTRVVRIRGTVVDSAGAPIERASVGLAPRDLGTTMSIGDLRMTPGGGFEITNVPAGSYILSARTVSNRTTMQTRALSRVAFLPVEIRDANLEDIKLQLTSGKEVRGTMRWEGGGTQSAFLTASTAEGLLTSASVTPGSDTFVLRSVWPLTYMLDVRGLCSNCYVKSVRYGGRDVPEAGIDFSGDGELEIVVSASAPSLDGIAVDRQGRPAGGATVMLEPADGTGRILSGRTDARGAFHFGGLRPGAYRVYAWEGAAPEASPEMVAQFQAQASAVRLEESARLELQIATIKR